MPFASADPAPLDAAPAGRFDDLPFVALFTGRVAFFGFVTVFFDFVPILVPKSSLNLRRSPIKTSQA